MPYILDLGDGWDVAVVDTEEEHDFIGASHRFLRGDKKYFIGGSVNSEFKQNFKAPGEFIIQITVPGQEVIFSINKILLINELK